MRYVCLEYIDEETWNSMPERERNALIEKCSAYDELLRKDGHAVNGETLQSVANTTTLRFRNGRVSIADGPIAGTGEQLGAIIVLEATDLNHAIRLMSAHPIIRAGAGFEVRPVAGEHSSRNRV